MSTPAIVSPVRIASVYGGPDRFASELDEFVPAEARDDAPDLTNLPQSAQLALDGIRSSFAAEVERDARGTFVIFTSPEGEPIRCSVSAEWSQTNPGVPVIRVECQLGAEIEVDIAN